MLQEISDSNYSIVKGHRLMQKYVVMSYARDQAKKIQYHRHKVKKKKQENYLDLGIHLNNDKISGIYHGKKFVISSSFYGSIRWYLLKTLESLAIFRQKRKPDIFITIKFDINHPDILKALTKHQTSQDIPDIFSRVFKHHL